MKPSHRQAKIYETFDLKQHNLLVEAVAGSGKTTVLLELLKRCDDGEAYFLAFNKAIQKEIDTHIKTNGLKNAKAKTLHSLGLLALSSHIKSFKINNMKSWEMSYSTTDAFKKEYWDLSKPERSKLNRSLVEMNKVARLNNTVDFESVRLGMISMNIPFDDHSFLPKMWSYYVELRERSYRKKTVEIDFLDMIYLPVKYNLHIPAYPKYLFIDEAQDLNLLQHTLIDNLINQGDVKHWVAVGDRKQAIYGFSGSYSSSFDLFKEKDNVIELPLDICYRCPSKIIDEANKVYDVMTGFKTEEGIVERVHINEHEIEDGSMVICRNTNPLIELYFQLLSTKRKVYIKGDEIHSRIESLVKPERFKQIHVIVEDLMRQAIRLKTSADQHDKAKGFKLEEDANNLSTMVRGGLVRSSDNGDTLLKRLTSIFQVKSGGIMLCTIHKSKGLENDVVYIYREDLIPSKFAKSAEELVQEENLRYVARTRAKKKLYYLDMPSPKDSKK
jgi:DNA helicase II / ATP-dependent DNA helicase PcrA